MRSILLSFAITAIVAGPLALAGEHQHGGGHGGIFCPKCHEPCHATITKDKETKTCWEVECKAICIPKVTFPWEHGWGKGKGGKDSCPPPKCGRTKYVNVLMVHEYECTVCKYSWDVSDKGDGKDGDKGEGHYYDESSPDVDAPFEAIPEVPAPPPVEARRSNPTPRPLPVRFETIHETNPAATASPRAVDILTSFFK